MSPGKYSGEVGGCCGVSGHGEVGGYCGVSRQCKGGRL